MARHLYGTQLRPVACVCRYDAPTLRSGVEDDHTIEFELIPRRHDELANYELLEHMTCDMAHTAAVPPRL